MSTETAQYRNFVGGELVSAVEDATMDVVNPANEQVIASVPRGSRADVDRAVGAAKGALTEWLDSTPAERATMLLALAQLIEDNADELGALESRNVGKPLSMAVDEMAICVDNLRFFAGAARILEGKAAGEYLRGYTSMIRREPVGVVAQIVPWNYPLMMAVWKIAPALAAGNAVVLKPAEETPLTALRLAELAADIIPAGVLNVITGEGETVGAALVEHPDVDMVALTGGVDTGRLVAAGAAPRLKRVHLELGGKAPVVVFDDADIEALTETLKVMGYWNSGQECGSPCRVLASDGAYGKLIESLGPAVESIKVGDPGVDADIEMGPVISRNQQERVLGFLERATSATVLTGGANGGASGSGYFVTPTVLTDVKQTDEIVQNEVFGPVMTVQRFADESEALTWANDVEYGLAASVWTRDVARAHQALRKLRFGTVWVNDHLPFVSEMPWGGFKQSGYGHDLSIYSLEDYTTIKHAMVKFA